MYMYMYDVLCYIMYIMYRRDLSERLERLAVNCQSRNSQGSISASSDTVESEGRQMKQC